MNFQTPTRVWINQPSKNYQLHKYHGKAGIALTLSEGDTRLYFETGPLISMSIPENCTQFLCTQNSHTDIFKLG